jgi:hypothetical protein
MSIDQSFQPEFESVNRRIEPSPATPAPQPDLVAAWSWGRRTSPSPESQRWRRAPVLGLEVALPQPLHGRSTCRRSFGESEKHRVAAEDLRLADAVEPSALHRQFQLDEALGSGLRRLESLRPHPGIQLVCAARPEWRLTFAISSRIMSRSARPLTYSFVVRCAIRSRITSVGALRRTTASNRHSIARVCHAQHRFSLRGSRR